MKWLYAYNIAPGYCKVLTSELVDKAGWMADDPELLAMWRVENDDAVREALAQWYVKPGLYAMTPARCISELTALYGGGALVTGMHHQLELGLN